MSNPRSEIDVQPARSNPVWWIIAVSLAVIALNLTFRDGDWASSAVAQSFRSGGARGTYAFTGPVTPSTFGVYMVDTDNNTLWCYEIIEQNGLKKLRLIAARSWLHDKFLRRYNIDSPDPEEVEAMVRQEREHAAAAGDEAAP